MNADRDLLENAAKAAGIKQIPEWFSEHYGVATSLQLGKVQFWNPLTDDGDALRLGLA